MPNVETTDDLRATISALTMRVYALEQGRIHAAPVPIPPPPAGPLRTDAVAPSAVESRLASYWAARLGIVSLVTGLAFLVAHSFENIGPFLKTALGYACAASLAAFGRWISGRHRSLGQVIVSGGLGVAYYTTYAIHHVESVRLIESAWLGFALLAATVGGIVYAAQAMRSETVAGLALFLGLHTGMVSEVGVFTLASGCLLAIGAAYFLVANRWVIVPLSTLVAVYSTLVTWLLGNPLVTGAGIVHSTGHLALALAFVSIYYLTFAIATALSPRETSRLFGVGFAIANWVGAALIATFEVGVHSAERLELVFAALALASLALAVVFGKRKGREALFHCHLALTATSVALMMWGLLDGGLLLCALCVVAVASALVARSLSSVALRTVSACIAAAAVLGFLESGADNLLVALIICGSLVADGKLEDGGKPGATQFISALAVLVVAVATASALAPSAIVTIAWVGASASLFAIGTGLAMLPYRLVALGGFGLAFTRLFLHDLSTYSAGARIGSFLIVGALLLAVSFVYARRSSDGRGEPAAGDKRDGTPN